MAAGAALRFFGCLLVSGTVVGLAAGAHVLGGGALPDGEIVLVLTGLVLASVMQIAGRGLSLARIAGVLGGGQVLLHEAFSVLSPGTSCEVPLSPVAAHPSGHAVVACLSPSLPGSAHTAGHGSAGVLMALAHLLAVAVTVAVISRAEAALWRVVAWLRPLTHPCPAVGINPYRTPRVSPWSDPAAPPWRNLAAVGVRGPPPPAPSCPHRVRAGTP